MRATTDGDKGHSDILNTGMMTLLTILLFVFIAVFYKLGLDILNRMPPCCYLKHFRTRIDWNEHDRCC